MTGNEGSGVSASAEWKQHWPLVLASTIGYSFGMISTNATGLFLEPVTKAFGWSRAEFSLA